MLIMNIKKD